MSIVVVATIHPVPEHRREVTAALAAAVARVHSEDKGCELYALHEGTDRLIMVEKWESEEALRVHGRGAALLELNARLDGKLSAPADVQLLQPHPAGTAQQGTL